MQEDRGRGWGGGGILCDFLRTAARALRCGGGGGGFISVIFRDTPTGNNLNPYMIMCIPSPRSKEPPSLTVVQGAAGQNRAAEMEKHVFRCL